MIFKEGVYHKFDKETGSLVIQGKGKMDDYNDDNLPPWAEYKSEIKSIKIKKGITYIGSNAFDDCTGLTNVTIPDSVTTIGKDAFSGCTKVIRI